MNCGVGTLPKQEQDQGQDQVQDRDHKKEQKQGQGADCDPRQDLRKDCAPRQEQEQEQGGDGDSRHSGNCFGLVQCFDLVKDLKDPNRIFIVSGATGGIGQSLCKTLIDRGAKRVIALGRDRKDLFFDERLTFISVDLNEANSNLRTSFKKAVESLNLKEGSLFTFIHAAGFTNDKNALSVTSEDFASMAAVKYHAPDDIIAVLKSFGQLDSFLGLSSVTTLAGNIGQASYVLGNSLLESLAKRLQKEGVRAAALALGPVKGLGMLKDQPRLLESFERFFGMRGLDITEILNFLFHEGQWSGSRRHFENAVVHFFAASSNKLLSAFKDDLRSCCLSLRAGIDANEDSDGLKEKLKLLGKKERFALLEDLGAQLLASLMGVSKDTLDPKAKISSLGLDSLLVMEFAGLLEEKLEVKIPLSLFDTNASLSSVAEALEGLMFSDAVPQASFTQAKDLGTIGTAAVMPSAKNDAGVNSALEGDLGEDDTISLLQRQHGLAVTDNLKKQLTTDSKGN